MRYICVCPAQIIKSKPQESDLKRRRRTWQLKFHKKETIPTPNRKSKHKIGFNSRKICCANK